jgi:MFS superfamily sulfate permease-like transporter
MIFHDIWKMKNHFQDRFSFYSFSFLKHDLKASITVFFVAIPLCLGISLASGATVYAGLAAGIIGGIVVGLLSGSNISVSGPAAGLTAICAAAITEMGSMQIFILSVCIAGMLQFLIGLFRLGGFTHFIPSAVIKGILSAIGIILISKQIPALIGYDKPEFWSNELFNIITFNHVFSNITSLYNHSSFGAALISILSLLFLIFWKKQFSNKNSLIPASFATVLFSIILTWLLPYISPALQLKATQFVTIPQHILQDVTFPDFSLAIHNTIIWKTSILICFVATLETLLSIEAADKLDPYNRITPQNRELMAQGAGNFFSGLIGGLPVTAVIIRSSANAEAGAITRLSAVLHGIWILLIVLFGVTLVNMIPFCVLAVILIRTGFNLTKPGMIKAVYKQGKEQFLPFIVTVIAILLTNLLIGVLIGLIYSIYFIIRYTYKAGFTIKQQKERDIQYFTIELAMNVSFLNKKKILTTLDAIPSHSVVSINGSNSVYIDNDVLEIIQDYKSKAKNKHITLKLTAIPEVQTIELH